MNENDLEIKNEYTFQRAYVIYYEDSRFLHFAKHLPIKITYISNRQKAIYCYTDERYELKLKNQLKNQKGKIILERAPLFDENLNF